VTTAPLSDAYLARIQREFPAFRLRHKRDSRAQRAIGKALELLTLGGMRTYVSGYHTVMFGTLWVSEGWEAMGDLERYVLLRHERVHLAQARRWGALPMGLAYLLLPMPLGLAYCRARVEWEAYEETLRALVEVHGIEAARRQRAWLKARFVGPDYGWMWPFPGAIDAWFEATIAALEGEVARGALPIEETLRVHRAGLAQGSGAREA
jgi:hypothetical protein